MNVVWFKRDLRTVDHEALAKASMHSSVLPLYILEPELWQQPDMSYRHYAFLSESLYDLDKSLQALGHQLIIKVGDAEQILQKIHSSFPIRELWSHQETWNDWTYQRDQRIKRWTHEKNIPWREPRQNGIVRCLMDRDGWAVRWYKQMNKAIISAPVKVNAVNIKSEKLLAASELGLEKDQCLGRQKGGRSEGLKLLHSFLYHRGEGYTKEMSSPVTAFESCSRLSAHIAFGTLSLREVFHASVKRNEEIRNLPYGVKGKWPSALKSFSGRLRWHCHFMQKLEDEPAIEFKNMHPAYNGLRENDFNEKYFNAWATGTTGYPMVDACMRALIATGWLNFRMRALLMSFASYHLWLHWQKPALHLARLFVDYEPGIHYSQIQMQSGTTGINSIRIYNPIKQGVDHDPDGVFIRKWIPELRQMDQEFIHTPWKAPSQLNGYPMPIVDEKAARKAAADKVYGLRKNNLEHKNTARKIIDKHGSRKSGLKKTTARKNKKIKLSQAKQLEFPV